MNHKLKNNIKNQKKKLKNAKLQEVPDKTCKTKLRSIKASRENGVPVWLTVIQIFFFLIYNLLYLV